MILPLATFSDLIFYYFSPHPVPPTLASILILEHAHPSIFPPQGHCLKSSSLTALMVHSLPTSVFVLMPPFVSRTFLTMLFKIIVPFLLHVTTYPPSLLFFFDSSYHHLTYLITFYCPFPPKRIKAPQRIFPLLFTALSQMLRTVPGT